MLAARNCSHGYAAARPLTSNHRLVKPSSGRSAVVPCASGGAASPSSPSSPSAVTSQQLLQWDKAMIAVSAVQSEPAITGLLAGPGRSSEAQSAVAFGNGDADLLWAGYSDVSEQLRRLHASHATLQQQVEALTQRLNIHHQQQHGLPAAGSVAAATAAAMASWQAASFLFMFLCFINVAGFISSLKAGFFMPFWAAKPAVEMLWLKGLLSVALPITNTAVILIFCLQAVKAAWACVRW